MVHCCQSNRSRENSPRCSADRVRKFWCWHGRNPSRKTGQKNLCFVTKCSVFSTPVALTTMDHEITIVDNYLVSNILKFQNDPFIRSGDMLTVPTSKFPETIFWATGAVFSTPVALTTMDHKITIVGNYLVTNILKFQIYLFISSGDMRFFLNSSSVPFFLTHTVPYSLRTAWLEKIFR